MTLKQALKTARSYITERENRWPGEGRPSKKVSEAFRKIFAQIAELESEVEQLRGAESNALEYAAELEDLLNEAWESGIASDDDKFWQRLHDLLGESWRKK